MLSQLFVIVLNVIIVPYILGNGSGLVLVGEAYISMNWLVLVCISMIWSGNISDRKKNVRVEGVVPIEMGQKNLKFFVLSLDL